MIMHMGSDGCAVVRVCCCPYPLPIVALDVLGKGGALTPPPNKTKYTLTA
jgi:hypothetical protein